MKRRRGGVRAVLVLALAAAVVTVLQVGVSPRSGPAAADAATGPAGLFVPVAGRLLDTRNGTGGYSTPMPAGGVRTVTVAGQAGIPDSGVSAVALTLTAVGAGSIGAVSVAPGDVATPSGAQLVFNPGDSVSNTALVALHDDGSLRVLADHAVNLIIDVQGYFTAGVATAPGGFVAVSQGRLADTRSGKGLPAAKVSTGGAVTLQAGGLGGVPADASAVYANVTVLNQAANGYLRTYAADQPAPSTGALDFDDSATAQSVAIPLSPDGRFAVLVGAGGPVDLVVDIQGYFTASAASAMFTPAAVHLLDTRVAPVRTLAANSVTRLTVAGLAGIPAVADGLGAVALNLRTVHQAGAAGGYLKLWPSDQAEPGTSNINYTSDTLYRTDLAIIAPAADGSINVRNGGAAPVDLVLDVEGWFADPGPSVPIVQSADYPAHSWTPAGGTSATFTITDTGTGTPATRFTYHLDDDPPAPVTGSTISFTPPTTLGAHTLSVVATDRYGVASPTNVYTFNIGAPPAAPTDLVVTAGAGSADLTWITSAENGAPVLGYTFAILDRTTAGAPVPLGSCTTCTHFVLTGLDPTHSYAAQVTAGSPAGDSPASTSGDFTAATDQALTCPDVDGTDDTCASQDITKPANLDPLGASYDQSGTDADPPVDAAQLTDLNATDSLPCAPDTGRVGPWSCSVPDTSSTDPDPSDTSSTDQDPSAFGYCNIMFRCYGQSSAEDTCWHGTIYYGWNTWWGRYTIGSIKARITWSTSGGFTQSKMYFNPVDKAVHSVLFTATMFNGSPYARHGGSPIHHTLEHSLIYGHVDPNREITWTYFDYNTTMYDHNLANQFNWQAPGYEGSFYLYVRSPVAHTNRLGNFARYRFPPLAGDLPLDTAGWGHHW